MVGGEHNNFKIHKKIDFDLKINLD